MAVSKLQMQTFAGLPDIIGEYVLQIPEERRILRRGEDGGTWTIEEHLFHLADVQPMLLGRMRKILSEENPVIEPYFPENGNGDSRWKSIDEALESFRSLRREQCLLIGSASEEDLLREAVHGEYERYTIPLILSHMIFHEYWHMYRIEEIWLTRDGYFS